MTLSETVAVDVVIDACVLNHACREAGLLADSSLAVFEELLASSHVLWALDDTGKAAPDMDTSAMVAEYRGCVGPQSFPMTVLAHLAASERVTFVVRPGPTEMTLIRKLVPDNKRDQIVLATAARSADRVLVSNDDEDFYEDIRDAALDKFGVRVLYSWEVCTAA